MKIEVVGLEDEMITFIASKVELKGKWMGTSLPNIGEVLEVEMELSGIYAWGLDIGVSIPTNEKIIQSKVLGNYD